MVTAASSGQDNLAQFTIPAVLTGNQAQVVQLAEAFSEEQYHCQGTLLGVMNSDINPEEITNSKVIFKPSDFACAND